MVDTIILTLEKNMFNVTNPDMFEPSAHWIDNDRFPLGSRGYITSKQNPTRTELKQGIYKPYLTITKRFYYGRLQTMMKIQFSAPKLLYKNNFDEIDDVDFYSIIDALKRKLRDMGVLVNNNSLAFAPISAIHYSKNIVLTNGLTPYPILKEIQKSNISQRLDFNQTDFRNEGHSIKFRANSFEIVFYDKMRDMEKAKVSEMRAEENDNSLQIDLFEELNKTRKQTPLEVFRMEIRLNQRQKIRQVLKEIGYYTEPTLINLFKKEISQKVLLYYLDQIEINYPKPLFYKPRSFADFVAQFCIDNPSAKLKDVVLAFGFSKGLEEISIRETRELLGRYPVSSWYAFKRKIDTYKYTTNNVPYLQYIKTALNEFVPLKTALYFQGKISNNISN